MTRREAILAAVRTTLTGTTGVGTRIYRNRAEPMTRAESPALVVEPVTDIPVQNTSLPTLDWTLRIRVVVISRSTIADQAADPTIESLHSKRRDSLPKWVSTVIPGILNAWPSTTFAVLRPTPGKVINSSSVCGTLPSKSSMIFTAKP